MKIIIAVFLSIGFAGMLFEVGMLLFNGAFTIPALIIGSVSRFFFFAGYFCFTVYLIPKRLRYRLIENNEFVMAEVVDIDQNVNLKYQVDQITIHPFIIRCRYKDQSGNTYDFKSRPLLYNPSGLIKEQRLKVYVNLQNPRKYLVDTDAILPSNAVLHKFKVMWNVQELEKKGQYVVATTCGVELIGQLIVKGCLKPMYLKLSDEAAKQFHMPRDSKNRAFMGYTVLCRYEAPDGVTHIFASKGYWGNPDSSHIGERVKVYYEGNNYQRYYVAMEEIKK